MFKSVIIGSGGENPKKLDETHRSISEVVATNIIVDTLAGGLGGVYNKTDDEASGLGLVHKSNTPKQKN